MNFRHCRLGWFFIGWLCLSAHGRETHATWTEPLTGMVFVEIPKGCFQMGTRKELMPSGSLGWKRMGYQGGVAADERPPHRVCVDAFWMARHEVRVADWRTVMREGNPNLEGRRPMTGVNWHQAQAFANELSGQAGGASTEKIRFRLPTEAEWEYACLANEKVSGNMPVDVDIVPRAWFGGSARTLHEAAPVETLSPNAWGLHDLLGNAWEWVEDVYRPDAYAHHVLYNPVTVGSGSQRVIRGGSYRSEQNQMRCANRGSYAQGDTLPQIGFRLVMNRPFKKGRGK